jgi:hypothetical protein
MYWVKQAEGTRMSSKILDVAVESITIFFALLFNFYFIYIFFIIFKSFAFDVKINNFFFTWLKSIIFIGFYVIFFFILRILQLGNPLDLKDSFNKVFNFFISYQNYSGFSKFIVTLFIIILILLWLLIFFKIQKLLVNNLWKLSFYFIVYYTR